MIPGSEEIAHSYGFLLEPCVRVQVMHHIAVAEDENTFLARLHKALSDFVMK